MKGGRIPGWGPLMKGCPRGGNPGWKGGGPKWGLGGPP